MVTVVASRAVRGELVDWTYRRAKARMLRAGRAELLRHTARGRLDDRGNRLVDCGCGWSGNGLGWAAHLDHVIHLALDA
jgi:hypothetical protein